MIDFEAGKDFLVAVQRRYRKDELIEARGLKGRIIEPISAQDYVEVWRFRGSDSEGLSLSPQFYYRCQRISDKPRLAIVPDPESEVRGDQESA
jgi:hypothetical protein